MENTVSSKFAENIITLPFNEFILEIHGYISLHKIPVKNFQVVNVLREKLLYSV